MDSFLIAEQQWFSIELSQMGYQYKKTSSANTFILKMDQRYTLTTTFALQQNDPQTFIKM